MKVATGVHLLHKRCMAYQTTLFADLLSVSNFCPNSFHGFSLDCLTIVAAVLHAVSTAIEPAQMIFFFKQALNAVFFHG